MSDTENNIEIEVKEFKEDEVFNKPEKKKRKLTDKQKEALATGRAKAKAKRDAIKNAELEKQALKKVKKEQKDIEKAKNLETSNKNVKKQKLKDQDVVREKIKKREYDRKYKKYTDVKTSILEKCPNVKHYDALNTILKQNITEEDIMDEARMKDKLHNIITYAKKHMENKQTKVK